MFWSKKKSLSWVFDDNWNASHSGFVDLMESSMKKSFKFDEMCFELKWKMVKWMESEVFETWKCFPLENFDLRMKTFLKIVLDPLWSKKCVCALPPKLLSHSPKENGKYEAQGVEMWGFYTCMDAKGSSKVTQKFIWNYRVNSKTFTPLSH